MRSLVAITLLMILPNCLARPVSYPSGTTVMQMNNWHANSLHLHYSPTANYSIGYKGEYWRDDDWAFHGLQLNYLVKRWNRPASQANIYLKSGLGLARQNAQITAKASDDISGFTGISLDWEDRRFFTFYENRLFDRGEQGSQFTQTIRLGVAPYLGDYGDLHTWIMLQVEHDPDMADTAEITPIIRLFKQDYLAELGINDAGALFNFIIRY